MKTIITYMVALLLAASATAQTGGLDIFVDEPKGRQYDTFADAPGWRFFRTPAYCYASIANEDGTLLLGYDQRRNQAHVGFWSSEFANYNTADTTNIEIVLVEIVPGKGLGEINHDWGFNRFVVVVNKGGRRVFNGKLNGLQMLHSFSRFDRLTFMASDGQMMQNFSLAQSAQALSRLTACRPQ